MDIFEIEDEYIQLNQLLKVLNWVNDGAHANAVIDDGLVKVNGTKELRRRNKIMDGFVVEFNEQKIQIKKKSRQ